MIRRHAKQQGALRGILVVIIFAVTSACGPQDSEHSSRVYTHVLPEEPASLDPLQGSSVYSQAMLTLVYDTLFRYSYFKRPRSLVPSLATQMPEFSEDGTMVTIDLRQNVIFADSGAFDCCLQALMLCGQNRIVEYLS